MDIRSDMLAIRERHHTADWPRLCRGPQRPQEVWRGRGRRLADVPYVDCAVPATGQDLGAVARPTRLGCQYRPEFDYGASAKPAFPPTFAAQRGIGISESFEVYQHSDRRDPKATKGQETYRHAPRRRLFTSYQPPHSPCLPVAPLRYPLVNHDHLPIHEGRQQHVVRELLVRRGRQERQDLGGPPHGRGGAGAGRRGRYDRDGGGRRRRRIR